MNDMRNDFRHVHIVHQDETERDLFLLADDDEERRKLVYNLKLNPTAVRRWLALLNNVPKSPSSPEALRRLIKRGLDLIPAERYRFMPEYVDIWLLYAYYQPESEREETFEYLLQSGFADYHKQFYIEYVKFEMQRGNRYKADFLLDKALMNGVITDEEMKMATEEMNKGRTFPISSNPRSRQPPPAINTTVHTPKDRTMNTPTSTSSTKGTPTTTSYTKASTGPSYTSTSTNGTSRKEVKPASVSASLKTMALRVPRVEGGEQKDDDDGMGFDPPPKTTQSVTQEKDVQEAKTPRSTPKATLRKDYSSVLSWTPKPLSELKSSRQQTPQTGRKASDTSNGQVKTPSMSTQSDRHHVHFPASSTPFKEYSSSHRPQKVQKSSPTPTKDPFQALQTRVVVDGKEYSRLEQIGSGGSSKVYRMLGPDLRIYALKRIKLKRLDAQSIKQYNNEIDLLQRLQGNEHIIRLIAAERDANEDIINVVMEHGEIDLSERLKGMKGSVDENFLRVIWKQMLQAVDAIHKERIVHGDLKPANFLFVNGVLKLIDFGIAKAISNDTTNIQRESQVGTVNFMSPEAIQGVTDQMSSGKMKMGRASDIWSLGCILYQIVYGKPPFASGTTIVDKFRLITDPNYVIQFPPIADNELVEVMRLCLQRDHTRRPPIEGEGGLLSHPFLRPTSKEAEMHVTPSNALRVMNELAELLQSRGTPATDVSKVKQIVRGAMNRPRRSPPRNTREL